MKRGQRPASPPFALSRSPRIGCVRYIRGACPQADTTPLRAPRVALPLANLFAPICRPSRTVVTVCLCPKSTQRAKQSRHHHRRTLRAVFFVTRQSPEQCDARPRELPHPHTAKCNMFPLRRGPHLQMQDHLETSGGVDSKAQYHVSTQVTTRSPFFFFSTFRSSSANPFSPCFRTARSGCARRPVSGLCASWARFCR